jgi:hypothetical protein
MTKASEAFEQQIQRIYELLLDSGADVTWMITFLIPIT